ncbi:MAG: Malto-oligosyltrehalose trehalohydrolase [Syntrophorhabdus sp. PtaB.Bin047]|jgi:maltooligosyltrehalose trehalohydrolase|nr:MAG: Malto-oligosyltrehalose trehalohydrolase [Syntrophorhabdus sp. PtaB.Bin047]
MRTLDKISAPAHLGAVPFADGSTSFRVWAPFARTVSVDVLQGPRWRREPLAPSGGNYFEGKVDGVADGDLYRFAIDDSSTFPDPASRSQPKGVHGPSQVVDNTSFPWSDNGWQGRALEEYIIYELHVGTFTGEGTFEAIVPCLDYFRDLGVNAIELMPVSQFPGSRNWGYDGTFPFAPHNTYGGPRGLKTLVNACHEQGLAVILDVVYNHLGPEGNYLANFGPYFTDRYRTPWGDALNFDGPFSDEVRNYFVRSALDWFVHYHVDALRLDAIHGIFDFSARTFLQELSETVASALPGAPPAYLIAESDLNDIRVITPRKDGGIGLDAQWNDDFHHALHTLLTGEKHGYYQDFGDIDNLAKSFAEGYVYTGEFSSYRARRHGGPSKHRPAAQFIVFSQNHDQAGNRPGGERLAALVGHDRLKVAAMAVLLSPSIPLLFMGEEYGETAPFLYFVDHSDEGLMEAVRTGRTQEFAWFPSVGEIPDPQEEETFVLSRINRESRFEGSRRPLFGFYRHLISLRRSLKPWQMREGRPVVRCWPDRSSLFVMMPLPGNDVALFFNFSEKDVRIGSPLHEGLWTAIADTLSPRWGGSGEIAPASITGETGAVLPLGPLSAVAYRRER